VSTQLAHLFGAYFHQDWGVEAEDWKGVLQLYLRDVSESEVVEAVAELKALMSTHVTELQLESALSELGSYYALRQEAGGAFRQWLGELCAELSSSSVGALAQQGIQADAASPRRLT